MKWIVHHNKGDRKGMLALIFLISAIGILSTTKMKDMQEKPKFDFSKFQENTNISVSPKSLAKKDDVIESRPKRKWKGSYSKKEKSTPNSYDSNSTGATDIKKSYSQTENYVRKNVNQNTQVNKKPKYKTQTQYKKYVPKKKFNKKIDVNDSAVMDWQALPGIGPYYSKIIINFRNKLGGFASLNQIGETWHLPDSTFRIIKPYLELTPVFRKLDINTCTIEDLKNHPYVNWKQAKLIVNYRNEHGDYISIAELSKIIAFENNWLEKINPYLSVSLPEPLVE